MGITGGDPEFVVGPVVAKPDELDAGISVQIDQVAISRRAGNPAKYPYAAIVAVRHPIDLLLEDRPATDVPGQQSGLPLLEGAANDTPFDANRWSERLQSAASRQA